MSDLTGAAAIAGVMGWPVAHSRSPRLHGYWLREHGIDGAYVPLAVPPDGLEMAIRALPALGFRGVNVTVPHKERTAALMDRLDPAASRIGAVNTVVVGENGDLTGRNTDGFGFLENLRQEAPAWRADAGPAVVVGAGGAARAVTAALLDAGAPRVDLLNRTVAKAEAVARDLGGAIAPAPLSQAVDRLAEAALLVNTTSLGMVGEPPLDLDLAGLPPTALVTDIVYTPLETDLLRLARTRGNPTVDGLGMLLHQARPGFEAWFGVPPAVTPALRRHVLGA